MPRRLSKSYDVEMVVRMKLLAWEADPDVQARLFKIPI